MDPASVVHCVVDVFFLKDAINLRKPLVRMPTSASGRFLITEQWFADTCYMLDGVVFDFDAAAGAKFGLGTSHQFSSWRIRDETQSSSDA
jgi:hypothetical protein